MPGRRGSMYDPARDAFVEADEATQDSTAQDNAAAPAIREPTSSPNNKRKRSASVHEEEQEKPTDQLLTEEPSSNEAPQEPDAKKARTSSSEGPAKNGATPGPVTSISQLKGMKKAPGSARASRDITSRRSDRADDRRRSRSPARQGDRRRTPPRRRTPSPAPLTRSPSPGNRSPPRQRKRPGAGARVKALDTETVRRRQEEREQQLNDKAQAEAAARGVHDVVRQHYNAVPQRGKEWRKTESNIRGLRSFNNWIKSCIIQRFSPSTDHVTGRDQQNGGERSGLLILDMGCGKGGDLQKWHAAPQKVDLYVGLDPANVSIDQARDRYVEMKRNPRRGGGGYRDRFAPPIFHAEFQVKDCFGESIADVPIVQEVGINPSVGPGASGLHARFGEGGFDVVTMMFSMHYAFESEMKARTMLRNVAGALKKGGRFIGVIPNSDILTARVNKYNAENAKTASSSNGAAASEDEDDEWDPEKTLDAPAPAPVETDSAAANPLEWGNTIYRVKFPGHVPHDGVFRPPFGWKYFFFLEEAVEEIPEYVVPWEAFRALAVEYDLELRFKKTFMEIYEEEKDDKILGPLSERMGVHVRGQGSKELLVNSQELEAAQFYHAFCFYKA